MGYNEFFPFSISHVFMRRFSLFVLVLLLLLAPACSSVRSLGGFGKLVVLDIGHEADIPGAQAPGAINGKRISELPFWYEYAYFAKREIESAGYRCIIINRGDPPRDATLARYARKAGIIHIRKPAKGGKRYASKYYPDRVASGVVSADYALYRGADAVVFLHHNSSSWRWQRGSSPCLLLCSRYNGYPLASAIKHQLESDVLNQRGGMDNKGRGIDIKKRYTDCMPASGWLNVCDDAGIPGVVIEVAYVNNYNHMSYLSQRDNGIAYARAIGEGIAEYMDHYDRIPKHKRADKNKGDEGSYGYSYKSRREKPVPGALRLH